MQRGRAVWPCLTRCRPSVLCDGLTETVSCSRHPPNARILGGPPVPTRGLSTEPSADPGTQGLSQQGGGEHHRPPDFPDADRRTSVPSGLGFCFLCFCFLLRGNSTARFIFSSLKHEATNGAPVAADARQAWPRTDAWSSSAAQPGALCRPLQPQLLGEATFAHGDSLVWRKGLPMDPRPLAPLPQTRIASCKSLPIPELWFLHQHGPSRTEPRPPHGTVGTAYKGAKSASPRRSRNHGTEDPNPATRSRAQAWCGLGRASPQFSHLC